MEEELGGAVCDFCGDAGGASALILCENSHLGCMGGRHLYCFLTVKRELGQEEFYCDMCCAHRVREAAAKTRAEEAAAAAAAVEAAQLPPPKRQRVESRGGCAPRRHIAERLQVLALHSAPLSAHTAPVPAASQGAAPQRAGAAPVSRPVAAASRGTLSLALEGIEDDAVRRSSVIDGSYRSQHGPRELPSLSWQYTLANIVAGGALWSGNLSIPMSIVSLTGPFYPLPDSAAGLLSPSVHAVCAPTGAELAGPRHLLPDA